jgi:hypothetical protein
MNNIHYVVHEDHIALFIDGEYYEVDNDPETNDEVIAAADRGDADTILEIATDQETRTVLSDERFELGPDGLVYLAGTEVAMPRLMGEKIQNFVEQGFPVDPMVNFWKYCILNPSDNSRDMLFGFLQKYNLPITKHGYFIAYKRVQLADYYGADEDGEPELKGKQIREDFRGSGKPYVQKDVRVDPNTGEKIVEDIDLTDRLKLVDLYTGQMNNSVGEVVEMDREDVVENPSSTCDEGLHVAAMSYIPNYGSGAASISSPDGQTWSELSSEERYNHLKSQPDPIVKVLVNPADVVSVPNDHGGAKMRVCRYYVMSLFNGEHEEDYNPTDYITQRAADLRTDLDEQIEEKREEIETIESRKNMLPA